MLRIFATIPRDAANPLANQVVTSLQTEEYIAFGLLAVFIVVYFVIKALYVAAYIRSYVYDADASFVTIRKGVFSPAEIHVQYQKIQDVYVDQDFLDRLFGLYDVHLASATVASGIEAHIDGVDKVTAEGLKNFLLGRIQGAGVAEASSQEVSSVAPSSAAAQSLKASLADHVSSATYPISGTWIVTKFVGGAVVIAIGEAFIWLIRVVIQIGDTPPALSMLGLTAMAILVLVLGVWGFFYNIFWKANYCFDFTDEYLLIRTGVVSRQERHMPYRAVQDVIVSQSIFERLFGIASVTIQNAAGSGLDMSSISIPGQPIEKANQLSQIIRQVVLTKNPSRVGL